MLDLFSQPGWVILVLALYMFGLASVCVWFLVDIRREIDCLKQREERRRCNALISLELIQQVDERLCKIETADNVTRLPPRLKPYSKS